MGWFCKTLGLIVAMTWAGSCYAETQIKLLEPGTAPRQSLRLAPLLGAHHVVDLLMRVTNEKVMDGNKLPVSQAPATKMTFDMVVTGISPGEVSYAFECIDADLVGDPTAPDPMLPIMREAIVPLIGLRGTGVLSDRAESLRTTVNRPAVVDPVLEPHLEGIRRLLEQLTTPFPTEAVGIGGKWEVTNTLNQEGFEVQQTVICTLAASDGRTVEINVEIMQRADPQVMVTDGLPPGASASLVSYSSAGTGRTVHRLSELFPTDGAMDVTNDSTVVISFGGNKQEIAQRFVMDTELKGRKGIRH
jgi:hypothetical protein